MSDSPIKTDFPIKLGGKEYLLSFPLPAVWAFEDKAGVVVLKEEEQDGLFDPNATPEEQARARTDEFYERIFGKGARQIMQRTVQLLWAGLITHQPTLTVEEVGKFVFVRNVVKVREEVMAVFARSLGAMDDPAEATAEGEQEGGERPLAAATAS